MKARVRASSPDPEVKSMPVVQADRNVKEPNVYTRKIKVKETSQCGFFSVGTVGLEHHVVAKQVTMDGPRGRAP